MGVLPVLLQIAVALFAVSSMLTVGFKHKLRDVISPLHDIPGVISAVIANFLLVPLLAVGILQLIPLDRPMATGMIIVAADRSPALGRRHGGKCLGDCAAACPDHAVADDSRFCN